MDSTTSSLTDFNSVYSAYLPQRREKQQFILGANTIPAEDYTLEGNLVSNYFNYKTKYFISILKFM